MLKNLGKRLLLFVCGLLLTVVGGLLTWGWFSIDSPNAWASKIGGYVLLVPLFGIAMVCMAFAKEPPKQAGVG